MAYLYMKKRRWTHMWWINKTIKQRETYGVYYHPVQELELDSKPFYQYSRMTREQLGDILFQNEVGWWDEWGDTVLLTQDSKFVPWHSESEHATSRSRRLHTILTFTRGWGGNSVVSFKPPGPICCFRLSRYYLSQSCKRNVLLQGLWLRWLFMHHRQRSWGVHVPGRIHKMTSW